MALPANTILNLMCCIDTQDQTSFSVLNWKFNSNPGGYILSNKTYTLKDCTFLMMIPKDSIKLILPQLLVLFTSGVNNSTDGNVVTIMKESNATTTQTNLGATGFILNLIDSFDLSIPGDTIYTYFLYKTNIEYEFSSTAQEWNGIIKTWDYRRSKSDVYDIQYLDETTNSQFPYLKSMNIPVIQNGENKKLANHLILTMCVKEK